MTKFEKHSFLVNRFSHINTIVIFKHQKKSAFKQTSEHSVNYSHSIISTVFSKTDFLLVLYIVWEFQLFHALFWFWGIFATMVQPVSPTLYTIWKVENKYFRLSYFLLISCTFSSNPHRNPYTFENFVPNN